MTRLTQAIITKILFGRAVEHPVTASLLNAITILNSNLLPMMFREMLWGGLLNRLPLPSIRRGRRAATALHETVDSLIRNRRRDADALLTLLEGAYDENTQARLTDQQIHDQLTTFFLAGHETTACALAWTFYFLTEHPAWAERLQTEATRVIQSNSLTPEELDQLILTRQVIEEAMRLMPPVPSIGRRPDRDTEIGGWPIPAGSIVFMSPYVMHRHPRYWEVPERFDPDRFAPQRSQGRPRYAYFPFSGGPRTCIGAHLAMMEMLTIVALVVRHFRLGRVPGRRVVPQTLITLRPRFGVPVTISRR
jgi:cytochrome P450